MIDKVSTLVDVVRAALLCGSGTAEPLSVGAQKAAFEKKIESDSALSNDVGLMEKLSKLTFQQQTDDLSLFRAGISESVSRHILDDYRGRFELFFLSPSFNILGSLSLCIFN